MVVDPRHNELEGNFSESFHRHVTYFTTTVASVTPDFIAFIGLAATQGAHPRLKGIHESFKLRFGVARKK